ncbi:MULTISPECIES: hypothetical protein [Acidithrix]|uniref:hypothetical protein n=1 Tax=Acidithrix TaxID=1609233 RepID=UPI001364DAC0|nr:MULTISPECIES: hypothetical protein [Acidithrix]CAG4916547.1 unnamed protein product [Acidithrix sp. C25]
MKKFEAAKQTLAYADEAVVPKRGSVPRSGRGGRGGAEMGIISETVDPSPKR